MAGSPDPDWGRSERLGEGEGDGHQEEVTAGRGIWGLGRACIPDYSPGPEQSGWERVGPAPPLALSISC